MPNMKKNSFGALIFSLTDQERTDKEKREELDREISEARKLKQELLELKKQMKGE